MKKLMTLCVVLSLLFFGFCGDTKEEKAKKELTKIVKKALDPVNNYKLTLEQLKAIGNGVEAYITDNMKAPVAKNIVELKELLEPLYLKNCPIADAFGGEILYWHGTGDTDADSYKIGSKGSDGKFEGWDQTGTYREISTNDIIYSIGNFVYFLEK